MRFSNHWKFRTAFFQSLEVCALLLCAAPACAEDPPPTPALADPAGAWRAEVDDRGGLRYLEFPQSNGWLRSTFRTDALRGPCWQVKEDGRWQDVALAALDRESRIFTGQRGDLRFGLRYEVAGAQLAILASLSNSGARAIGPLQAGLRLGLDIQAEGVRDWQSVFHPTLLRCEPTHFWGYFMTPRGRILGIGSPDPVAAWHLDGPLTASLDLLQPPPLPPNHPTNLHTLQPGETRIWTLYLESIDRLEDVVPRLAAACRGPLLFADSFTIEPAGLTVLRACSATPLVGSVELPDGRKTVLSFAGDGPGRWAAKVKAGAQPGPYAVRVRDLRGREARTTLTVRHPWSWYLEHSPPEPPGTLAQREARKTLLAVMAEERPLARTSTVWRSQLQSHYAEVEGAMNNLMMEGAPAPGDGRLASSYAQLAWFAMWVTNDLARPAYIKAAFDFAALDRCFVPLSTPDTPITAATAPRIRGWWYLYRLTGQEDLLRRAYDQLGHAVQAGERAPEIVACLKEVAYAVCHVIERPGSTFVAYNGTARVEDEVLVVEPAERCVTGVQVTLRRPWTVRTTLGGRTIERRLEKSGWLGRVPSL